MNVLIFRQQKGNALFLILIAVALFAALSYAVTQSGRGGAGIDREQAEIAAAQLVQYSSNLETTVQRLRLINRCRDVEISFHYDSDGDGTLETDGSDDYYNPNSPTDGSCNLFDPNGGGLTFFNAPDEWKAAGFDEEFFFPNASCVEDIGTNGTGTTAGTFCDGVSTAKEHLVFLAGISTEICESINKRIDGSSLVPIDQSNFSFAGQFLGAFEENGGAEIGDNAEVLRGQSTYCFQAASGSLFTPDGFVFYHVLWAR